MTDYPISNNLQVLMEKYLMPLPEKVQLAISLIDEHAEQFIGAERTSQGVQYFDSRTSVFEIGSITKIFTATLLADEVGQGALSLNTPVQELVPFKLKQSQRGGVEVTLKHLASHTSGMCHQPPFLLLYAFLHGHPRQMFLNYSQKRYEHYLRHQMNLAFTPGEKYRYSNMGMSLVGYVLSKQANMEYEALIQQQLFTPLGMGLSTTWVAKVQKHVVPGLEKANRWTPNWDMYALSPAGGIKTCTEDFAKFVRRQLSPSPAISMTQTPTFRIAENYFVGLGWHILDRPNGDRWLNHGGGMLGYTANVNINLNRKSASIVLSNLGNVDNWQRKCFELSRDLLDY